ncbi:hypothetical protein JCM11491_000700 [Sporobolomyces phaffii]
MASDDPALARVETASEDEHAIASHLHSRRQHRHLRSFKSDAIYRERINAEHDTVTDDWFDLSTPVGPSESTVKLTVRRAGSRATDTWRKLSRRGPRITVEPGAGEPENQGIPLVPQQTNSSFNTITLPAFDLARYRSTSSNTTLSSLDCALASPPPERVPTPPPFPTSPDPRPPPPATAFPSSSPFLALAALSPTPVPSSSPTSSLDGFPARSASPPPPHDRRTLTIDDYSPPSRRDTGLSSFLSRTDGSIVAHLKHSLHLNHHHHHGASSASASSPSRPHTPPGMVRPTLSRSPTSTHSVRGGGGGGGGNQATTTSRHRAKEELQRLLARRKTLLSRKGGTKLPMRPPGDRTSDLDDDDDDDDRDGDGDGGAGIERAIFERLKVLGALVDETERVETDVLWEHQRGLLVFGLPKFSSAALFQFDPSVWTDDTLRSSPYTPHDFPCRPYWRWRDQEFMVDMGGDRDEEGWSYAVFFHSKHWRGEPSLFRSFVRRRRWIRTRIYIPLPAFAKPRPVSDGLTGDATTTTRSPFFRAIDGTEAGDQDEAETDDGDDDDAKVHDLESACACLPLSVEEKEALYASLAGACATTTNNPRDPQYHSVYIPPANPFIPFRVILEHAKDHPAPPASSSGRGRAHDELVWRQGIREINERRVKEVVKKVARIDRERLRLWKTWLRFEDEDEREGEGHRDDEEFECSEWSEWRAGEKSQNWTDWIEEHRGIGDGDSGGDVNEGERDGTRSNWEIREEDEEAPEVEAEDFADKRPGPPSRNPSRQQGSIRRSEPSDGGVGRPDLEDVWDLIESRLDNILALFDYHLTRLSFLRLVLACHPLASTPFPADSPHSRPRASLTTPFTHKHEGYDLPFEARRRKKQAEWEKRLKWVLGVREEVERMQGGGDGAPVGDRGKRDEAGKAGEKDALERSRSERRARKGKQRAVYPDQ